ncbi:MAG: ATP-binding cassette domain-containing protein [Defluviitaleaceae bacterium]|nr:ATP-binding cassette domain-containing protein [Defluviitaleaceae bacterium]
MSRAKFSGDTANQPEALLEVKNLCVEYRGVRAVDGVSFAVSPGEIFGIAGASGSGKSTIGKTILGLVPPTSKNSVFFNGRELCIRKNRSPERENVQMIFQNVHSSLNPKKRVLDIIAEPLRNFQKNSPAEEYAKVCELLAIVGLSQRDAQKFPHEFSGGQRQRIGIARATALRPRLIVADEPVSALDLSVRAQVLNYMKVIRDEFGTAFLFISHDLGVMRHMCENLAIMHNGRFVETGSRDEIFNTPRHIYTRRLIAATPDPNPDNRDINAERRRIIEKEWENENDS